MKVIALVILAIALTDAVPSQYSNGHVVKRAAAADPQIIVGLGGGYPVGPYAPGFGYPGGFGGGYPGPYGPYGPYGGYNGFGGYGGYGPYGYGNGFRHHHHHG